MDSTIINPALPFKGTIPNGLYPGRVIVVKGVLPHSANSFAINLCSGNDIVLHVNPRLNESCIVRNNYKNGSWCTEERQPSGLGGLVKGQMFEMMILTELSHYKVAINGRHFTQFAHRVPYQSVQMLQVDGDIQVHRIEYRINFTPPAVPVQPGYPPAVCPNFPSAPGANRPRPIYNPAIPLKFRILGGLDPNYIISISGKPTTTPHRFGVNLTCDSNSGSSGDIAFHFSVRFDQFCVVRNSLISGTWGNEERGGGFPFQAGVNFDLNLRVFPTCYEITVNGQYFGTFTHRVMPINRVSFLEIDSDVVVSSVRFL